VIEIIASNREYAMSANAAIYFEPEGYSISGPRLMGRNAAGYSFLNGFFEHAVTDSFTAFTPLPDRFEPFKAMAAAAGVTKPLHSVTPQNYADLSQTGCLYLPGPGLGEHAWQRSLYGERSWSLCGITHTTLSGRAMEAITGLLTAPVEPWDALICTSRSVRDTVRALLEAEAGFLTQRLGATRFTLPRLPVIPLGIDTKAFDFSKNTRNEARRALGIGEDAIVVLFVGRLSFHAKAHPAALYDALQQARGKKEVILIECGWFANDFIGQAFDETANLLAPNIRRIILDGREAVNRERAWASADIFSSLTDNLQETFGITPLEAMASGLPVVVTDWDGYRDSVRQGIDGFRIRTFQPPEGHGIDLAKRHAIEADNYDHYCGLTSQLVAVDIPEAVTAFKTLFSDPALRRQMGEAGKARARTVFDWSEIIRRYQDLWLELEEERRSAPSLPTISGRPHPWPARMEPFTAFASYASEKLGPSLALKRNKMRTGEQIASIRKLKSFTLGDRLIPLGKAFTEFLHLIPEDGPITIKDVTARAGMDADAVVSAIAFGLKIGALTVEDGP
jgi:glycosyltransferase involved in cell wall biosynthesis